MRIKTDTPLDPSGRKCRDLLLTTWQKWLTSFKGESSSINLHYLLDGNGVQHYFPNLQELQVQKLRHFFSFINQSPPPSSAQFLEQYTKDCMQEILPLCGIETDDESLQRFIEMKKVHEDNIRQLERMQTEASSIHAQIDTTIQAECSTQRDATRLQAILTHKLEIIEQLAQQKTDLKPAAYRARDVALIAIMTLSKINRSILQLQQSAIKSHQQIMEEINLQITATVQQAKKEMQRALQLTETQQIDALQREHSLAAMISSNRRIALQSSVAVSHRRLITEVQSLSSEIRNEFGAIQYAATLVSQEKKEACRLAEEAQGHRKKLWIGITLAVLTLGGAAAAFAIRPALRQVEEECDPLSQEILDGSALALIESGGIRSMDYKRVPSARYRFDGDCKTPPSLVDLASDLGMEDTTGVFSTLGIKDPNVKKLIYFLDSFALMIIQENQRQNVQKEGTCLRDNPKFAYWEPFLQDWENYIYALIVHWQQSNTVLIGHINILYHNPQKTGSISERLGLLNRRSVESFYACLLLVDQLQSIRHMLQGDTLSDSSRTGLSHKSPLAVCTLFAAISTTKITGCDGSTYRPEMTPEVKRWLENHAQQGPETLQKLTEGYKRLENFQQEQQEKYPFLVTPRLRLR
ncbi:MAG: hypothetical protein A2103_03215 [Gammaproteobacteria bacterium GWF2_41_13]|nr:MAG: hypothetical protein A2103_03215 [Gammaproteobacteria bacterium GWF2_41_13]